MFLTTLLVLFLVSAYADQVVSRPAPLPTGVSVPARFEGRRVCIISESNEVQVTVTQRDLEQIAQKCDLWQWPKTLSHAPASI